MYQTQNHSPQQSSSLMEVFQDLATIWTEVQNCQ